MAFLEKPDPLLMVFGLKDARVQHDSTMETVESLMRIGRMAVCGRRLT